MARCCGDSCACKLVQGTGITITGTGSSTDPYVISGSSNLGVADTTAIDLTLTGNGSSATPWVISGTFAAASKLDFLGDVNAPAPTNGFVLAYNTSTQHWEPVAPTTAASGSVQHDNSLTGDGSSGSHLAVQHAAGGFTETVTGGIKLTDTAISQLVRNFTNAASRSSATPAPDLNTLSMLDSNVGQIDYWDGTQWKPFAAILSVRSINGGGGLELVNLSGDYDGRPMHIIVKNIAVTTDTGGVFDILTPGDLSGYAGVLSVNIQAIGTPAWTAVINNIIGQVSAVAYRLSSGTPLVNQPIVCTVQAYVY